jgi:Zn-dependent M28 family amino/carboxypeptidase
VLAALILQLVAAAPVPATATAAPTGTPTAAAPAGIPERLLQSTRGDGQALARLAELTDTIGPRLTGSPGATAAVAWALRAFQADGLTAWTEAVTVPAWRRGEERAVLLAGGPVLQPQPLAVTALGNSPATPAGGLDAEVIEVRSLAEVAALGERARGKLIFFDHDMKAPGDYGSAASLRVRGPAAAARAGAAGALVRSLATASLRSPHTGMTSFHGVATPIPSAALSVEDAGLLHRLLARGPVRVRLTLGCGFASPPRTESANVLAELRGRERPEEVVVIGAHLDSWDLGTGAIDDGAGVVMVMETLRQLSRLPVAPRRTVRAVLFMNEENGLEGGLDYARRHAAELPRTVAALEVDSGAGSPRGVEVSAGEGGLALLTRLAAPLAPLGAAGVAVGDGGSDISPLQEAGVPVVGIDQETSRYFDWHHSAADTFDKVVPAELAATTAALAVLTWQLAEAPETLPRRAVKKP